MWCIGSSYLARLRKSELLTSPQRSRNCIWAARGGMKWEEMRPRLDSLIATGENPQYILIHLGSNDLCSMASKELYDMMNRDLLYIRLRRPASTLIWSVMLPRHQWRDAVNPAAIEVKRKKLNRRLARLVVNIGGRVVQHKWAELTQHYLSDGVHLNNAGMAHFANELLKVCQ